MSQLLKIVLIDSLCAASKAELAMDGNTSVTGANGIGKSSFMKLIPVFYGAPPGRLVKAGSNRESFANWYLPNASSFIVFEYTNFAGVVRCALMHRSGEGYSYRLVPRAWSPDLLYRDYEAGQLVLPSELHRHLAQQSVDCSPELQPLHYRRIIQFNSGSAHLEGVSDPYKRKMIMGLRPSFSLAPKRKDFNGIDNVTLALLESGGTFDTMKATMAEILQQENPDPGSTLMMLNAQPFRNVVDSRAGYLLMDSLKPKIQILSQTRLEFQAVVRQLGLQKRNALYLDGQLKQRQAVRDAALEQLVHEETALDDSSRETATGLNKQSGIAQADLSAATEAVESIEKKRDEYLQQGAAQLLEQLDRLPEDQAQCDLKQNHLDQLNKQGLDIREVYAKRALKANDEATQLREGVHAQNSSATQDMQARQEKLDTEQARLLKEAQANQTAELEEQQRQQGDLALKCAREESAVDHLKIIEVLPHAQAELNQAQQSIDDQQAVMEEYQRVLQDMQEGEGKLHQEQIALGATYQGVERQKELLQNERAELKAQLSAGSETLLGFLRRHHPNWTDNIARLVPVETLMRTDLNPALVEEVSQSLYGVELSLNVLPAASIASEETLESEIASASRQLEALDTELEGIQRQRRSLGERMRQHSAGLSQAQCNVQQAIVELEVRKSQRVNLLSRAHDEHAQLLEIQCALAAEAATNLRLMAERVTELKSKHALHLDGVCSAAEQAQQDLKRERSQQQAQYEATLRRIKTNLEKEQKQIEQDLAARLQEEGINDSENQRLEAEIKLLEEHIKKVSSQRSLLESYRHWREKILPLLPQRIGEMKAAQGEHDRIDRLIHEHYRRVDELKKHIADRRKVLVQEGNKDSEQLVMLHAVISRLSQVEAAEAEVWNSGLTAADIEDQAYKLLRQRAELQKKGSELYRDIPSRFRRESLGHTTQGAAIEQIVSQASNATSEVEYAWLEAAPNLQEYIEVSHPDQKVKLIVQAKNLSDELCDSRAKLQQLHKSIQKLGRDATAKASEVLSSFAQIRQFEFKVTSRIHSMTFWDDLSAYEQQYRRWAMMGDDHLPTDGFMAALRSIEHQIREGAFSSKLSDCFDVSVSCNDQGRTKIATNNADLIHLSSTGLTKIIVAMIYVSLFELLRQDADFQMSIPIDEALELSAENYVALVNYFNERGLSMLACFPGGAPELLRQFKNRYTLERRADSNAILVKEYGLSDADELDELNAALAPADEEFAL
ncbi:ATP-binding protein [Pseudomonas aeruginosa]|uniref:ATP-binding protein n=1 Tax=Pseudomonas aeruginosa TaxID=287 RepID=UPI0039839C4C